MTPDNKAVREALDNLLAKARREGAEILPDIERTRRLVKEQERCDLAKTE